MVCGLHTEENNRKGLNAHVSRLTKIILIVVLAMQCVGIYDHSLWTPDEPRVAEIAREMSVSGDYLIPHFSGQPFLEQPPLYYASAALGFKLWGTGNEGNGRMASALYGMLTVLVVFYGVRRLYTQATAALAVAILAGSCLFFQVTHKMLVDSALVFFITVALLGFLLAYTNQSLHGYKFFWLGMALAFLTKGVIGVAIPGVAVAAFIVWQGDLNVIRRIWAVPGGLLLLGVMGLWTWVLYHAGGHDFLRTFYVHNHLGRFLNGGMYTGGHVRPFYYYISDFWAQGAPWSLLLIPFFITSRPFDTVKRFFCAWLLGGMVLLSLASTKRGLYLLPLMPAMAVMVAVWMSELAGRIPGKWERALLYLLAGLFILCSVAMPIGYVRFLDGPWTIAVAVMVACVLAAWFIHSTGKPNLACMLTVYWCLFVLLWTPAIFPQIDTQKGYKDLFVQMGRVVADQPVVGYRLNETVEALAPYYGNFYVESIDDRLAFRQFILSKRTGYALVLPSRLDPGLKTRLKNTSIPLIRDTSRTRKDIELWKLGNQPVSSD
jgi:4-amino-4-deoxy-L-arabinose transferase-like glycosyltransferase